MNDYKFHVSDCITSYLLLVDKMPSIHYNYRYIIRVIIRGEIINATESKNYTMGGGTYSKDLPCAITFGGGFPNDDPIPDGLLPEGHGGAHSPDEIASIKSLLKTLKVYVYAISKLDDVI